MKTLSQICTDAAQALMVEPWFLGPTLFNAGGTREMIEEIYTRVLPDEMNALGDALDEAASELGWETNDFRIFLLLNAAEALK